MAKAKDVKKEEVKAEEVKAEEVKTEEVKTEEKELPKVDGAKVEALVNVTDETVIILRASKPLKPADLVTLQKRIDEAAEKHSLKLVLIPHSAIVEKVDA